MPGGGGEIDSQQERFSGVQALAENQFTMFLESEKEEFAR